MNFLQLCQAAATDSGTVAGFPSVVTLAGVTGRAAQLVGWVRDAYIDIQNERSDWKWMRQSFSHALTIDQIEYDPVVDLEIDDFASFIPDVPAEGWRNLTIYETGLQEQEGEIVMIPYPLFRQRYQRGTHDHNKPSEWAVSPQGELLLGTKPDKAYILRGEYRMAPEELAVDADTPSMPERFHRVIVQEALRLMMRSDEAYAQLQEKSQQYDRLRSALVNNQTPDLSFGGGSLA